MSRDAVLLDFQTATQFETFRSIDQAALDALPVAMCLCGADGVVLRFNRRATDLRGRVPRPGDPDSKFSGGLRLYDVNGTPLLHAASPMAVALRSGEPAHDKKFIVERADGSRVSVIANIEPLMDAAGRVQGAINCFHDVTAFATVAADSAKHLASAARENVRLGVAEQTANRLAAIVESSDDAIISKDTGGIVASWNAGAERLFGYTAEEMIGRPITILIPQGHENEEPDILARIRRGERVEHYETVRRRKDGSLVDISLTISPVRDGEGNIIGASKIARNISERKEAEAQRDLLVAELSHRVKNTLATVISIAHQSFSRGPSIEEARDSFTGRIRALAQTHSRLAEGNWYGVSFNAILNDELAPYRRDDGANIELSGSDVTISTRCAVVLGMALHELVTNAAKYGALSVKEGVVAVRWNIADDTRLHIHWEERGGPSVVAPTRSGFGSLLLKRALAADLNGEVRMDFAVAGLVCDIALPMDTVPSN